MTDLLATLPPPQVKLPLLAALTWVFERPGRVIVAPSGLRFRAARTGDFLERQDKGPHYSFWAPGGVNLRDDIFGRWTCEEGAEP